MTSTRLSLALVSAAALFAIVALVAARPGSAAFNTFVKIEGTASSSGSSVSYPNCAILDNLGCPMGASGVVTCTGCQPGAPASGNLSLSIETLSAFPPNPCRVKSASGVFTILWNDSTTTTVRFDGRFRDGKSILVLAGTVTASSNPFFPPGPPTKGELNGFPPNPCVASSSAIVGSLSL